MTVTPKMVADQLAAYLRHGASLAQLVDWAEQQMAESDFESEAVRDAVARLGLADVRAFGLTWEDCEEILHNLGFAARVEIAVSAGSSTSSRTPNQG